MKNHFRVKEKKPKSQIAVIITLVIAFIVLFSVVLINIAQVGEIKNMTSKAADTAALKMASTFGSISKNYIENVDDGCSVDWIKLAAIVAAILVIIIVPKFVSAIALIAFSVFLGTGFSATAFVKTITSSRPIQAGIYDKFSSMSRYNAIREETLFSTLSSLQTDDALVLNMNGVNKGIFFEDDDNDGLYDAGEKTFDLRDIQSLDVSKVKYVGRFFAWYYDKRLRLVDESQLKQDTINLIDDLTDYISFEAWDNDTWSYQLAHLIVGRSAGKKIDVTCSASCPSWVHSYTLNTVEIVTIDEDESAESGRWEPGGFLVDFFDSFSVGLEGSWSGSINYCSSILGWFANCDEIQEVSEDLADFVAKYKAVVDMPESDINGSITQWFTLFYDLAYDHDTGDPDDGHDVYMRLTRAETEIASWIGDLKALDVDIRNTIASVQGECVEGRGSLCCGTCNRTYACNKIECGCYYCSEDSCGCCYWCCYNPGKCAFKGIYLTCCSSPPVCSNGDLYNTIPSWCPPTAHDPCADHCSGCSVNTHDCGDDSQYYQGLMAWNNTGGLTEVGQVIKILEALYEDVGEIKTLIRHFSIIVIGYVDSTSSLRNDLVYAWKGRDKRNHLVRASISNYPEKLPYVTEVRYLADLIRCVEFHALTNYDPSATPPIDDPFIIYAGRYDEDMPTGWWNLRYRRDTDVIDFDQNKMDFVRDDVVSDGIVDVTTAYLSTITTNYMISSQTKGYYGPEKEDIYIEKP